MFAASSDVVSSRADFFSFGGTIFPELSCCDARHAAGEAPEDVERERMRGSRRREPRHDAVHLHHVADTAGMPGDEAASDDMTS